MGTRGKAAIAAGMLGAIAVACAGCFSLSPVHTAPPGQAGMSVFVDPEATIAHVSDERGRELVAPFRDALQASLLEAGYRVVTDPSPAHDVDVHMIIDRVGWTYGRPWVNVVLQLSGGGHPITQLHRASLNYVSVEGPDATTRLAFAAHELVNAMARDVDVEGYAAHRAIYRPEQCRDSPDGFAPGSPRSARCPRRDADSSASSGAVAPGAGRSGYASGMSHTICRLAAVTVLSAGCGAVTAPTSDASRGSHPGVDSRAAEDSHATVDSRTTVDAHARPDASADAGKLTWYLTCGYPVCQTNIDAGRADAEVCPAVGSACTTKGAACGTPDQANCGMTLLCDDHNPAGGVPGVLEPYA